MEFWLKLLFGTETGLAAMIVIGVTVVIMAYYVYYFVSHVMNADPNTGEEIAHKK